MARILANETNPEGSLTFVVKGSARTAERRLEILRAFSSGLMGDRALSDVVLDAIAVRVDRDLQRMRAELSGLRPGIELKTARRGVSSLAQKGLQGEVAKSLGNLEGRILKEVQEALSLAGVRLVAAHVPFIENRVDSILDRTRAGMDLEFGGCRSLFDAARIRLARDLRIAAAP